MKLAARAALLAISAVLLLAVLPGPSSAEITGKGKQVSVRIPSFPLLPGERVAGIKVTSSAGYFSSTYRSGKWRCDLTGRKVHCYSVHPQYATADTGGLPELFLTEPGSSFSLTASVDIIDNSGKEYSKEINESQLIVQ